MYTVKPGELELLAVALEQVTTQLVDAIEDADNASHRLHGTWEGETASAHADRHSEWRARAEQMSAALAEIRQVLRSADENYAAAAAANVSMWGGA
ncbi:WXG100 family type VII secretion target [Leucobacter sp. NPDC058333]|uniref:WXG100 family type VII secretion target n=1 Tax=Leucobacter sp. NPDC058333 TaxID=3346450 RepID=UPI00364B6BF6